MTNTASKMSPEAQRVAIAEACGWKFECHNTESASSAFICIVDPKNRSVRLPYFENGMAMDLIGVPDYLSDLNAMHEVEKVLNEDQQEDYAMALKMIGKDSDFHYIHHAAAQRAEAFLKTLGLWVEEAKVETKVGGN